MKNILPLTLVVLAGCTDLEYIENSGSSVGALTCEQAQEIYSSCQGPNCYERFGPGTEYLCNR